MRGSLRYVIVGIVSKTYLVECFWPGVTEPVNAEAAARADAAARALRAKGRHVQFLDTLLVPTDEVVFYRFAAESIEDVEEASVMAELPFERVTEYVETHEASDEGAPP